MEYGFIEVQMGRFYENNNIIWLLYNTFAILLESLTLVNEYFIFAQFHSILNSQ